MKRWLLWDDHKHCPSLAVVEADTVDKAVALAQDSRFPGKTLRVLEYPDDDDLAGMYRIRRFTYRGDLFEDGMLEGQRFEQVSGWANKETLARKFLSDYQQPVVESDFRSLVRAGLHLLNLTEQEVTVPFGVSLRTLRRWVNGASVPKTSKRKLAQDFFLEGIGNR